MTLFVAAWLGSSIGIDAGYAELVEINHCCDSDGHEKFVQIIAWDWSHEYQRWDCQQWAIVTEWDHSKKLAIASDYHGKRIECRFTHWRETWTRHDPEVENRRLFDVRFRRQVW